MDVPHAALPGPHGSPAAHCRICLLGGLSIKYGATEIGALVLRRSHARRLMQMLGSAARHSEPRSKVLQGLWPDFDEARARNRLHHTVHGVRRALEELPLAQRPRIVVSADRVALNLPPGATIDWVEFEHLLDGDTSDARTRLANLEKALALYHGDLALDWAGCAEVDARRSRFARLRDDAMREAVDVALELGQLPAALRHAQQRASLLHDDGPTHCEYALLLQRSGRPDAALLHIKEVRALVEAGDAEAVNQLDETMRLIQRSANVQVAHDSEPAAAPMASIVSSQSVAAPRREMRGYDLLLSVCLSHLRDSYTSALTLAGPPGSGKSLLASWVAFHAQGEFRHGAVRVDATALATPRDLLRELAASLAPLTGEPGDDEAALARSLAGKELLVVVDGLIAEPDTARLMSRLASISADVKWLVTAWAPLNLLGERTLRVEPSLLLQPPTSGELTPAAAIIAEQASLVWPTADRRLWRSIEQLAHAVDGLPRALRIMAEQLGWMSPNELLARLDRDPASIMRGADAEAGGGARFSNAVASWLDSAPADVRQALAALSRCNSWLCRADLACLLGKAGITGDHGDADELESLLERCVRHHFLLRRMHTRPDDGGSISEFRVPRIVRAALAYLGEDTSIQSCLKCIERWIEMGPPEPVQEGASARTDAGGAWFDERIDDVDEVIRLWQATGQDGRLWAFCARHAARWPLSRHPQRVVAWLTLAVDSPDGMPAGDRGRLLIARARLRLRLGEGELACADARHALACATENPNPALRLQALALIQRNDSQAGSATRYGAAATWCAKGIEAGENLLRVAQVAARHGQFAQALALCDQCVGMFAHFNVSEGLSRAHLHRARMAFAMGNTALARRCVLEAQRCVPEAEAPRAALMRAEVDLHELNFDNALALASQVMARTDQAAAPALVARALQVAAWAHYAQGALPMAWALCREFREQASQASRIGLMVNAEVLAALIEARQSHGAQAIRRVSGVVDLLARGPMPSDIQSDLINTAELAAQLHRPELASRMLAALRAFGSAPQHSLRPWVAARMASVSLAIAHHTASESESMAGGDAAAETLRHLACD